MKFHWEIWAFSSPIDMIQFFYYYYYFFFHQKITEQQRSERQTRPPGKLRIKFVILRDDSAILLKNQAKSSRLAMRIWGRVVNRAIVLSRSNGGFLSKPLNPRIRAADASRRYIFSSASSSSGLLSDLNVLKSSPWRSQRNQLQGLLVVRSAYYYSLCSCLIGFFMCQAN